MTQVSDIGQEEAWGWPCPYCRAHNPVDALRCSHCGSQLREAEGGDLFTTAAADYAEVVPPEVPFARDNMWTTDANVAEPMTVDDAVGESELVDDIFDDAAGDADGGVWEDQPLSHEPPGFSAEPTLRRSDVIDEPFAAADEVDPSMVNGNGGPLFGGRANGTARPHAAPSGPGVGPFAVADTAPEPTGAASGPPPPPQFAGSAAGPGQVSAGAWGAHAPTPPVPDAHGLAAAVGRLHPDAVEAASVPISVCGALLERDEVVLAAVTGQMLGHAAVVVLTTQRVLVVNGRRWQPIVDQFSLSPELVVRGRHDRDIASLTFSQGDQLSTVDAITEVALAVEVAERIRGG